MSGHSKWANIKHKKGKADSQRGKIFTKIGREIVVAVKEGGANPSDNSRLRDVLAKARSNNMPNDNIQRSIKKAAGELGSVDYESITYEGYGAGGVAVIVEALTDNRNRTAADVRHSFDKFGGALGANGCVSWMFEKKGIIDIEMSDDMDEEQVMMDALEAGALDVEADEGMIEITTSANDFSAVNEAMEKAGYSFMVAEIQLVPENTVDITEEKAESVQNMLDMLEDNDDVQNVYHNGIFPDED